MIVQRAKILLLLVVSWVWLGCDEGASNNEAPQPDSAVAPDVGVDSGAEDTKLEPSWTPPSIDGVSATLEDTNPDPDIVEVELTAQMSKVSLDADIELDMMTYNGHFPGPLLQAKVGDTVIVHFTNQLDQPTTVHWHGLRIDSSMDGTPRVQQPVEAGGTFTYRFVVPDEGTFWYHPHIRAHEQVERGLYGPLVVHRSDDNVYDVERVVILDDMLLTQDSQGNIDFASFDPNQHMIAMHGRGGNVLLTNGQFADEYVVPAAQGQVERWRLVNTTNASTFELSLSNARFRVIGTDGGRLRAPYTPSGRLNVAVGQRYDLEVLYDTPGDVVLNAHVLAFDDNNNVVEVPFPMLTAQAQDMGAVPPVPMLVPEMSERPERSVDREVELRFSAVADSEGAIQWTINEQSNAMEPIFTFNEGETIKMKIINQAGPEHPFHLHGQFFEIVDDGRSFTTSQPGLKDTVLVPGMVELEIIAYMDNPGQWMAHCHILEHAELGMMSEIEVLPKP